VNRSGRHDPAAIMKPAIPRGTADPVTAAPTAPALHVQADDILQPAPSELRSISGSDNLAFSNHLLNVVASTLWFPEATSLEVRSATATAALAAVHGFAPRDAVEGMISAQAVALHHAAMECFRRAMLPGQSPDVADKLRRQGANLSRAMVDMAEAIDRRRGKGPQVVRVERVVVHDGGQAIVGAVVPPVTTAR
jgi:hypothetical protein